MWLFAQLDEGAIQGCSNPPCPCGLQHWCNSEAETASAGNQRAHEVSKNGRVADERCTRYIPF